MYIGEYDGDVSFDSSEIEEVKWISFEELKKDIVCNPTKYTPWFVVALKRVLKEIAHA